MAVELHYYHLWSRDCGRMGHNLDAEHVSVLVKAVEPDTTAGAWKAVYWYAAAHEDTACDVSHGASAKALGAEHQGPQVWISAGKHASFLREEQCRGSCGADQCDAAFTLIPGRVINIGESGSPLNGAAWATSKLWLLARKMQPDFTSVLVARLEGGTGVVSANESRASLRAVIAAGASSFQAIDTGNRHTGDAFSTATDAADRGLRRAAISAGSALKRVRPRIPSWLSGR